MKKFHNIIGLVVLVVVFLFNSLVYAAGSVTQLTFDSYPDSDLQIKRLIFLCTGDSSNGSIPNTAMSNFNLSLIKGMRLFQVEAYPTAGGTAPDAASVFILDSDGMDLLGAIDGSTTPYNGLNLIHATLKYATAPDLYNLGNTAHSAYYPVVTEALTLKVISQATASANWTVVLTFIK
jgi:hypothetical protein